MNASARAREADNRYRGGSASGGGGGSGVRHRRRAGSTAMATGTTEFSRTTRDDERLDRATKRTPWLNGYFAKAACSPQYITSPAL